MLDEDVRQYVAIAKSDMEHSITHLEQELVKVRAGKASPAMLDGLMVEYYGTPTPLNQVANMSTSDARTIVIQPWEKKMLAAIERAIFEANLGITPQNDGEVVRLGIPPLTEERRKDMAKKVKAIGEDTKVGIRNHRRDAMEQVKKAVKNGFPEDAGKQLEAQIEELTKKFIEEVDKVLAAKEKDIMTV